MRLASFPLISACIGLAMAMVGCGGGGGGSTPSHYVDYQTSWGALSGVSQRVTLMSADGTVISQKVLNEGSSATSKARFSVSSSATYVLRAELKDGPNFTGTTTGILETQVADKGSVTSSATGVADTVTIEPANFTVVKGATKQLYAHPKTSAGATTFIAPGAVEWSVSNALATVSDDGLVTGVDFGTFQVTAKLTSTAKSTTETGSVTSSAGATRNKWTVLVFMNSANNLYPYSTLNMNQMETVTNEDLRFVVQWKQVKSLYPSASFDGTRRYLVTPDTTDTVKSTLVQDMGSGVDMGSAGALKDFVNWGTQNYPADHYIVIVWSHGNGWQRTALTQPTRAVSYDDEFVSAISVWDLPSAFTGHHFDVISFDACLMQMLEVADEISTYADYIAASAENTPAAGYPYQRVFAPFATTPDAAVKTLLESFVTGHVENPGYVNQFVTQSVLDTSKIDALTTAVDELAGSLISNKDSLTTIIPEIRTAAPKYAYANDGRNYYDLGDLLDRMIASSAPTDVITKAQSAKTALQSAVIYSDGTDLNSFTQGLGIDFSSSTSFRSTQYSNLKLAQNSRWDDWLKVAP